MNFKKIVTILLSSLLLVGCSESMEDKNHGLDKENPVNITLGTQEDTALQTIIDDFNSTIGTEKGIIVEYKPISSNDELSNMDMVSADYNTIYSLSSNCEFAELSSYFSAMDLGSTFFESSIEEVSLSGLRAIPTKLDINLLVVNKSKWEEFSSSTGLDTSYLTTWDSITSLANTYYNTTNKSFLSISSGYDIANEISNQMYMPLVQTSRSGASINLQSDTMQNVWNYVSVPEIKGYFITGSYETIENGDTIASYCPLSEIPNSSDLLVFKAPSIVSTVSSYKLDTTAIAINSSNDNTIYACMQFINYLISDNVNYEYASYSSSIPSNKNANSNGENIDEYSINDTARSIAYELISAEEVFKVSPFDNVSMLVDTLETRINQMSSRDIVNKRIQGGVLESKAYEGILDSSSFKTWYDDICEHLKITFTPQ